MLDSQNSYVRGLAEAFEKSYTANGGKLIGKGSYTTNTTDFSTILDNVKTSGAQMLWIPDAYNVVNLIAAQVKEKGISVVASLCGTEDDPQDYGKQKKELEKMGVIIMPSNAQAARFSALVATKRTCLPKPWRRQG